MHDDFRNYSEIGCYIKIPKCRNIKKPNNTNLSHKQESIQVHLYRIFREVIFGPHGRTMHHGPVLGLANDLVEECFVGGQRNA